MGAWSLAAAVARAGQAARWEVTAGVEARRPQCTFHFSIAPLEEWDRFVAFHDGSGRLHLFDNSRDREDYADGAVIRDPLWSYIDGTAFFAVRHRGQLGNDGSYDTVTYHSYRYRYWAEFEGGAGREEENPVVWSPYIEAKRVLGAWGSGRLLLAARYGMSRKEYGFGWREVARERVWERKETYRFTYEIDTSSGSLPDPPFSAPEDGYYWVTYDADDYNSFWNPSPPMRNPVTGKSSREREVACLVGEARSDLDLLVHRLRLVLGWDRRTGPVRIFFCFGPTLNLLDWEFEYQTRWRDQGSAAELVRGCSTRSDLEWIPGITGEAALALEGGDGWFVQVGAGYEWADTVVVRSGGARAELDLGGYLLSFGVGRRW